MRHPLAVAILVAFAGAAPAGPLERLFSTPHLAMLSEERPLTYRHFRRNGLAGATAEIDEVIKLERSGDGARVLVTMDAEGTPRPSVFRGISGNPILMVFLESVVRTVSKATGGSPFYLRNRIKEAMRDGMAEEPVTARLGQTEVTAHRIELRPFEGDKHAAELGAFADLELSFVLAEAAPGTFLSLAASAGHAPTYSEEIRLDETR